MGVAVTQVSCSHDFNKYLPVQFLGGGVMGACGHHAAHAVLDNWSNLTSTK